MVLQLEFGLCGFSCLLCFFILRQVLNDCPSFLHILRHFLLTVCHFIEAKYVFNFFFFLGQLNTGNH
jgi:hypothetical protein